MALLRRSPVLSGSILLILCALSTLGAARVASLWPFAPRPLLLLFQQQYDPLDEVTAGQIAELRKAAGLDDSALSVCNLGDSDLENVLASLRTWWGNNSSSWLTNYGDIAATRTLIRKYESAINNGQDELTNRNNARNTLASQLSSRESLLANLRNAALNGLSQAVIDQIDVLRGQTDVVMPYCVVTLDGTQKSNLAAALVKCRQRMLVAQTDEERATIQSEFDADRLSAIGNENEAAIENLKTFQPAAAIRVVNAVQKVLPVEGQH